MCGWVDLGPKKELIFKRLPKGALPDEDRVVTRSSTTPPLWLLKKLAASSTPLPLRQGGGNGNRAPMGEADIYQIKCLVTKL